MLLVAPRSYSEQLGKWMEVGNSGMFRPEMLRPMGLPEDVNVIAWGLSLERPTMILYGIDNIRDLFGHRVCAVRGACMWCGTASIQMPLQCFGGQLMLLAARAHGAEGQPWRVRHICCSAARHVVYGVMASPSAL